MKKCTKCGKEKDSNEFSKFIQNEETYLRSWCKECVRVRRRSPHTSRKECNRCREVKDPSSYNGRNAWCTKCDNIIRKGKREKAKNDFLNMYGRRCSCCGDDRTFCLTLDHISPKGKDRTGYFTYKEYRRAVKKYRPDLFQILCFACNKSKHVGSYCGCGTSIISVPLFLYEDCIREG